LLEYLHNRYRITSGTLLDPFAGSGTALFTAGGFGLAAEGIELLPIGQKIIDTKQLIDWELDAADIARLEHWLHRKPWVGHPNHKPPLELRITRGAYPQETLRGLGRFLSASENEGVRVKAVLLFALLCILESVSFTRKDGQYLRWDHRSGRRQGKKRFDKGAILNFDEAITDKLHQIVTDLRQSGVPNDLFASPRKRTEIRLHAGSCLEIMPRLQAGSFDCVITSPPYCNRYDYTRTYALELALLGVGEEGLAKLRQEMLSCTVENRAKDLIALNPNWRIPVSCADDHELLQAILGYLEWLKELKLLNNTGIARMVRGYFYEMACVIAESARGDSSTTKALLDISQRYPGTSAGAAAQLLAAKELFLGGKYVEAQQEFSKFVADYSDNPLVPQANVGIAASLEAQGKIGDAVQQYKKINAIYSSSPGIVLPVKLTLGRLSEADNKPAQAVTYYRELININDPNDPWVREAFERFQLLVAKHPELNPNPPQARAPATSSLLTPSGAEMELAAPPGSPGAGPTPPAAPATNQTPKTGPPATNAMPGGKP
jgi:tetratricopeptide (TPR) repeat protein